MNQPLVSILMPCYNVGQYVEEAVGSILEQTYRNIEIVAINDSSTDDTGEILRQLAAKDNRVKVYENEENFKLIRTLNKGVLLCNGDYVARMDADDIALPERIEKEVRFLEDNPDHDIVSTLFYAFPSGKPNKKSLHLNPLRDDELRAYLLFKSGICHPAVMIRKRVFTELKLSFEQEYLHVEDYALWSKAIYKTKLANIGEPHLLYRVHPTQVSSLNEALQTENKKKVFAVHCKEWGLSTTSDNLDTYAAVAETILSKPSLIELKKCEKFMLSLIDINKKRHFCNQQYLEMMLSLHWLRLCANSRLGLKVVKHLKTSKLYRKECYSVQDMVILYAKCLFRMEYRKSHIYKIIFR